MATSQSLNWGALGGDATPTPAPSAKPAPNWGALDTAPAKPAPQENFLGGDAFAKFWQSHMPAAKTPFQSVLRGTGIQGFDTALGRTIGAGKKSLEWTDALLGAPQRFVAGVIGGDPANPHAGYWGRVHSGYTAMLQHNDKYDAGLEEGVLKWAFGGQYDDLVKNKFSHSVALLGAMVATDPLTYAGGVGLFEKVKLLDKLGNISDGIRTLQMSKGTPAAAKWMLGKFADYVENFTKPATIKTDPDGNVIDVTKNLIHSVFHPYARQNFLFNKEGYYKSLRINRTGTAITQELKALGSDVLNRNKAGLRSAKSYEDVPQEVKAWTLAEAAHFGTDEMKERALEIAKQQGINLDGFKWSSFVKKMASDSRFGGSGLTKHAVLDNYVPNWLNMKATFSPAYAGEDAARIYRTFADTKAAALGKSMSPSRGPAFEQAKTIAEGDTDVRVPKDFLQAYRTRVEAGANTIGHRWTKRQINRELGIGGRPENNEVVEYPWSEGQLSKYAAPHLYAEGTLNRGYFGDYLHNPHGHLIPEVEGILHWMGSMTPLRVIANAMTRGITNNSLPHIFNESRLTWLAGGPTNLVKGIARGVSNTVSDNDRLDMIMRGITTNTFRYLPDKPESLYDLTAWMAQAPPFKWWAYLNHEAMRRMDDALRLTVSKAFDAKYAGKMNDEQITHMVDEGLGGYTASPAFLKLLRGVGGMFPLWHARTVPVTTIKAWAAHPERALTLLRADQSAQQADLFDTQKYKLYAHPFGGSVYDTNKMIDAMVLQPLAKQLPTYLTSPSMIGDVGSAIAHYGGSKEGPAGTAAQTALAYAGAAAGPAAQALSESLNVYGSKQPLRERIIQSFFGVYPEYQNLWAEGVARLHATGNLSWYQAARKYANTIRLTQMGLGKP